MEKNGALSERDLLAINTVSACDMVLPDLENRTENLEALLEKVKIAGTEKYPKCYMEMVLLIAENQVLKLQEELKQFLDISNEEIKLQVEETVKIFDDLLQRLLKVDEQFRPYLFCPVQEENS